MDAKPVHTQRSPEPNPEAHSISSFQHFETPFRPSFQQKDVLLFEWWLIKTDKSYNGRRLAVGGFTKKGEAVGTFISAPIIKRHDNCTLETADGITLRIQGPLNKTYTSNNGFSLEVSTTFLFGFPTMWDSSSVESSEYKPCHQPIMGPQPENTFEPSSLKKTVSLRNWWLKRTNNMLAIGGFNELGKAMRIFDSSPITKRHDVYTLETADGIIVRLHGFIDKARTLDNGFSLEVHGTPTNQYEGKNLSILTPELLSLKRSRSGRLIIPRLDSSMRIIYEADGSIVGTANVDGSIIATSREVS